MLSVDLVLRHNIDAALGQRFVFALIVFKIVHLHDYLISSGDPISYTFNLLFYRPMFQCCANVSNIGPATDKKFHVFFSIYTILYKAVGTFTRLNMSIYFIDYFCVIGAAGSSS